MQDLSGTWPAEWLRGVLELCVLAVLSKEPAHGYAIVRSLADAGLGEVKGGTLYPLLGRLERDGLATSEWLAGDGGPGRKVVAITPAGRAHLEDAGEDWWTFSRTAAALVVGSRPPDPDAPSHPTRATEEVRS